MSIPDPAKTEVWKSAQDTLLSKEKIMMATGLFTLPDEEGCPHVIILGGDGFTLDWLKNNGQIAAIEAAVKAEVAKRQDNGAGHITEVRLEKVDDEQRKKLDPRPTEAEDQKHQAPKKATKKKKRPIVDPGLTFNRFILGGGENLFPYSAATALVSQAGVVQEWTRKSPIFFYGPSGSGKTTLASCIVNRIIDWEGPELFRRLIYFVNAEQYVRRLGIALRNQKGHDDVLLPLRNCHVLVVDDCQVLSKKSYFMEQMMYAIDYHLHEPGHLVIMCSQTWPREWVGIKKDFKGRIERGLTLELEPPSPETRLGILKGQAETINYHPPLGVLEYLATESGVENIRSAMGILETLSTMASVIGSPTSLELARQLAATKTGDRAISFTVEQIKAVVARAYSITVDQMKAKGRKSGILLPRQIAMFLCRKYTPLSLEKIGEAFDKGYGAVLNSVEKIQKKIDNDANFRRDIGQLETNLSK